MTLLKSALLIIDVQEEFARRTELGIPRSTPRAETNIARLLSACRESGIRVIHIHHHSLEPGSGFTAGSPGAVVQDFAKPLSDERVYIKNVNSGFIGTTLEQDLRKLGIQNLILCGATANHCVETTTRMAGNLGFDAFYVSDGVWAYGNTGPDEREHSPEDVLSMSLSNLDGEFAAVVPTDEIFSKFALVDIHS